MICEEQAMDRFFQDRNSREADGQTSNLPDVLNTVLEIEDDEEAAAFFR
jgi:hypothetical protein